jgi:filamentous hemagglutinin family protein
MTLQSSKLVSHRTFDQLLKPYLTCAWAGGRRKFESNSNLRTANRHKINSRLGQLSFSIICSVALFPASVVAQQRDWTWRGEGAVPLAQITPDNSVPTTVEQLQEIMRINGGQREGNNLFHSFDEFSIPEGMEAVFENATNIENIFTRVTGESVSNIDGILSTQGDANFFFINPNGVVFGNDAQLNVGGSFVASTADSIQFEDGSEFSAKDENQPTITMNFPIGLGLGSNPGAITVNGTGNQIETESLSTPTNIEPNLSGLEVNSGKTLALIGNNVNLEGGILTAQGGQIEIGSASDGSVRFESFKQGFNFNYSQVSSFENVQLEQQALVNASGEGSGSIQVNGANVILTDGSKILLQNQGETPSENLQINAANSLTLEGKSSNDLVGSGIQAETISLGKASDLAINTQRIVLKDGARIGSITYGEGAGGNVTINANDTADFLGSSNIVPGSSTPTTLSNSTYAAGNAGDFNLSTPQLKILDGAGISATTRGTGTGGDVSINANDIELIGGIPEQGTYSTISALSFSTGDSSNVKINTSELKVINGASITSTSYNHATAGTITIDATKNIQVSGSLVSQPSSISSSVVLSSEARRQFFGLPEVPTGQAGNLGINTPVLNVNSGAVLSVRNEGLGNGGTLFINAEDINLDSTGNITAAAASGTGGNINLDTNNLQLDNESQITTEAGNNGDGGNITINTSNLIAKKNSNLTTSVVGGDGGNINITADTILGIENSDITANAVGGNGGNINISSDGILGLEPRSRPTPFSDITASSEFGIEGTIKINSPNDFADDEALVTIENLELDSTEKLIEQSCFGQNRSPNTSRIIDSGRAGVPENPDNYFDGGDPIGYLGHRQVLGNSDEPDQQQPVVSGNANAVRNWQPGDPIVEANAVEVNSDGSQFLIHLNSTKSSDQQLCQGD